MSRDTLKTCKMCGCAKLLVHFYKQAAQADGHHIYCKECCAIHRKRDALKKRDKKSKLSVRQRIRARYEGVQKIDEDIQLTKLYMRDHGKCGICKQHVAVKDASIDHIVPISKGGHHTWDNVQLTHFKCNQRKSAKT